MTVRSTGGVELAVHDLGGEGPTLLISHATGFHGRCYEPVARALADRFHCVAFDYRGHGDSTSSNEPVDWERYGDDAVAMARSLDGPVVAFGHSMGGACLLMAAHREPALFRRLVLFEPIVFPTDRPRHDSDSDSDGDSALAAGARRRRTSFRSYEEAIANYAAKPPLGWFTPEALEAYVRHGFALGDDGQVHLKCRPDTEAATFEMGGSHHTWDVLASIGTPTLVIAGSVSPMQPSAVAGAIAERLPHAAYLELPQFDHFAPMTHPREMAELIAEFCGGE